MGPQEFRRAGQRGGHLLDRTTGCQLLCEVGQTAGVGGESVVEFLKNRARTLSKPFCLFISLVNPHDIGVYPGSWMKPSAWVEAGYRRDDFAHLGIKLPDNHADNLSTKPKIQKRARDAYNKFAPLSNAQAREDYVNFYAHLHTVVDKHIMTVLDTLEETGLMNDTIILRFADHGEGGLAHGMREKAYTVYEEMIHIPLIVHNPKLYPEPLQTTAFYDHLNLLPTILDLAGVPDPESYAIGKSIVPIIRDPSKTVQDHTIFSFDDLFFVLRTTMPPRASSALSASDHAAVFAYILKANGFDSGATPLTAESAELKNARFTTSAFTAIRCSWRWST